MRRIFIMRKDLHLTAGKMAAMVGHAAELYWLNQFKKCFVDNEFEYFMSEDPWHPGRPAIYHDTKLCKEAKEAFSRGEKKFKHKRKFGSKTVSPKFEIQKPIWEEYVNGIYTKTICEARNLNNLMKAKDIADGLGLKENEDYGLINDKCLTELKPENEDGTTTVGMWFAPLADETAHQISKRFPLLRVHNQNNKEENNA